MADFSIKRNDLLPALEVVLRDADGDPVDLTSATGCVFHMRDEADEVLKITGGTCNINADPTTGKVTYVWGTKALTDTDTAGVYYGEFEVTWTGGKLQSFPSIGYVDIEIVQDLA